MNNNQAHDQVREGRLMRQQCCSGVQLLGMGRGGSGQRHKIGGLWETFSMISYAAGHLQGRLARLSPL